MDPVGIVIIVVAIAAVVVVGKLVMRALHRSFENDAIWANGRPERARIVSIRETGRRLGRQGDPSPELELELKLDGSATRRTLKFFVRSEARDRIHEGATLDVRIAPDDDSRLAIDPTLRVL